MPLHLIWGMECLVKKPYKSGNSGAVIVPNSWINKEVIIIVLEERSAEQKEIEEIIKKSLGEKDILEPEVKP